MHSPTLLYNGMIAPFVGYNIKGAIWNQGESNRTRPEQYKKLLKSSVEINEVNNYFIANAGDPTKTDYTDATDNIGIGYAGLLNLSTGDGNISIGSSALSLIDTGSNNIAVGHNSGNALTNQVHTVNIGYDVDTTGNYAIAIGLDSAGNTDAISLGRISNTADSGTGNVAIGTASRQYGTTGTNNITIGHTAGIRVNSNFNIILGNLAVGTQTLTGGDNIIIGRQAGYALTSGEENIMIGRLSGAQLTATGDKNIFIGYGAGCYETGSNNFYITNQSGTNETDGRTKALMYGVMNSITASQTLQINADVEIQGTDTVLQLTDNSAYTLTPTTTIQGTLKYNSSGDFTNFGKIVFGKDNAIDGDTAGYTAFYKKTNAVSIAEAMRIDPNGNVGIAKTNPGSKLSVVGLPTSSSGLSTGDFFTQTATELGGSGTTKVICVV